MDIRTRATVVAGAILFLVGAATASEITPAGVLANSGIEGDSLVRAGKPLTKGCVYLADDLTVWFSGGDRIIHTTFDGHHIESYPIAPLCLWVAGRTFGALDGVLYFAGRAKYTAGLFALPMQPGAKLELVQEFPELHSPGSLAVCPDPVEQELLIGYPKTEDGHQNLNLFLYDPKTQVQRLFRTFETTPNEKARKVPVSVASLAYDPVAKVVYMGAYLGKYNVAFTHHPWIYEFLKLDLQGNELLRRDTFNMEASSAGFRGVLNHGGNAIWSTTWGGHIARMDRDLQSAPGVVKSWNYELDHTAQVVGVRDAAGEALLPPTSQSRRYDPILIGVMQPFAYLARWDRQERKLDLVSRLGCAPDVSSINLSPDGWVGVGLGHIQTWWRWTDGPDTPPHSACMGPCVSPGAFDGERLCTLAYNKNHKTWSVRTAWPGTSLRSSLYPPGKIPFAPGGFAVRKGTETVTIGGNTTTRKVGHAYASDPEDKALWRCPLQVRNWAVGAESIWTRLAVTGTALSAPGELAVLKDNELALVAGKTILIFKENGDTLTFMRQLERWGPAADQSFGSEIHIAGDGANLIVADTDRHRLLWFDAATLKLKGQFGRTDLAGTAMTDLDRPACPAVCGNRVAVLDAGNQRIIKAVLED